MSCPAFPTGRRQVEGELSGAQAAWALQEEVSPRRGGARLQVSAPHTPGQGAGWGGRLLGEGGFQVLRAVALAVLGWGRRPLGVGPPQSSSGPPWWSRLCSGPSPYFTDLQTLSPEQGATWPRWHSRRGAESGADPRPPRSVLSAAGIGWCWPSLGALQVCGVIFMPPRDRIFFYDTQTWKEVAQGGLG